MSYFHLLAGHWRLIGFGFSLTLFSSFGQTFFIALFGGEIREEFGLTHGSFGALYSAATLASGLSLLWLGSAIDRFDLRRYTRIVVLGLIAGAALLGAARGPIVLALAIYLLRLFGQGLMGHTAMTTVARFFGTSRGKALSVAALGWPAGEALLPRVFVGVKDLVGWRVSWWLVAAVVAVVLLPFLEWLFRRLGTLDTPEATEAADSGTSDPTPAPAAPTTGTSWTRSQVLRDPRFYLVLPSVLAPPFIATGLFFHQIALVEAKGWTVALFAGSFAAFAAAQLAASLLVGPLVDRFRASRALVFYLLPLTAALAVLGLGQHPATVFGFMLLAGASGGAQGTVVGAYWVEAYGALHLGSIRSLAMACMVFSTAAAPILLGRMIDAGVTFETIAFLCLGYTVVATLLVAAGTRIGRTTESNR